MYAFNKPWVKKYFFVSFNTFLFSDTGYSYTYAYQSDLSVEFLNKPSHILGTASSPKLFPPRLKIKDKCIKD